MHGDAALIGTSSFGMSGVNAHALLTQPISTAPAARAALQWQHSRLHVIPPVHSLLESFSLSVHSRASSFACRLSAPSMAFLWGCASLPPAVTLELALAAGSMLQDPKAAIAVQRAVLQGSVPTDNISSRPCLAISIASNGQVAVSSSSRPAATAMLLTATLVTLSQQPPTAARTRTAHWLPAMGSMHSVGSSTADLAPLDSSGCFCIHPTAQQAVLDLSAACTAAAAGSPAQRLAAAACLAYTPGSTASSAASSADAASALASNGAACTALSGLQMRAASAAQRGSVPTDSLAYAVEMQVASVAPQASYTPGPGAHAS